MTNEITRKNIELVKTGKGAAVQFPFELKAQFRKAFPSAKWNAAQKRWEVGSRSVKRLQQWIDEVNASGVVDEIASRDEADMSERELEDLRGTISSIKSRIAQQRADAANLEDTRAEIAKGKAELDQKRDELADIKSQRDAAAAAVEAERRDVHAIVSDVVDIEEIEGARREMRKMMPIAKAWASTKYGEAEKRLSDIRDRLEAAGIESEAVNRAIGANKNRYDRDFDDLFGPLDFNASSTRET